MYLAWDRLIEELWPEIFPCFELKCHSNPDETVYNCLDGWRQSLPVSSQLTQEQKYPKDLLFKDTNIIILERMWPREKVNWVPMIQTSFRTELPSANIAPNECSAESKQKAKRSLRSNFLLKVLQINYPSPLPRPSPYSRVAWCACL